MSLSSDWAQSQRNGWLCYLYGEDTGTGTKELPAQSIQSQLVTILSNLIDKELSPTECATKTAVLLRDESDFRGFCNNLWGMYFGAVEHFASEDVLQALVYYIVALAQLPDAMNDGHDEGLWKDLPDFKLNLVERFQGPEQYTRKHTSPASPESAAATWLNMNVWTELMARNEDAQEFGDLAGYAVLGLQTLIMALEHSPETRRGRHTEMHLLAAAHWLRVGGDQIEELCRTGTESFPPGDLWVAKGGNEACDLARFRFWSARLSELT